VNKIRSMLSAKGTYLDDGFVGNQWERPIGPHEMTILYHVSRLVAWLIDWALDIWEYADEKNRIKKLVKEGQASEGDLNKLQVPTYKCRKNPQCEILRCLSSTVTSI
jgi:hypothetical protein